MHRAVLLALLVGCGDNTGGAGADALASADASTSGFPGRIDIAAASQAITLPFDVVATGTGAAPLGTIAMTHDVGTVDVLHGPATAFVYTIVPFGTYTLFQGIGVTATSVDVFWLYCMTTQLAYVYDEGIAGAPLFYVGATGSCQNQVTPRDATVALPAVSISVPKPQPGYTVTGADITVATTGVGSIKLGGRTLPVIVFQVVDCSTDCGTPGWHELHSVIWDEANAKVIFTIVYLSSDQPGRVELTYARSLPDLADPIGDLHLAAAWTVPAAAKSRHVMGIPPPHARPL